MADLGQTLVDMHYQKVADLQRRASAAIEQLSDDDVNWRPGEESNSIANLVIHMAGNLRQRFVAGIGGATDTRDRDWEFNTREHYTKDQILDTLNESFSTAARAVAEVTPERLGERFLNWDETLLEVIFGVATHLSEHVGQILYIAKLRRGPDYQILWTPHKRP